MSCGYHFVSRLIQDQSTKHSIMGHRGLTNGKKLQSKRNQNFTEVHITQIFLFAYSGSIFWNVLRPSSLRKPAFLLQESNMLGLEESTHTPISCTVSHRRFHFRPPSYSHHSSELPQHTAAHVRLAHMKESHMEGSIILFPRNTWVRQLDIELTFVTDQLGSYYIM